MEQINTNQDTAPLNEYIRINDKSRSTERLTIKKLLTNGVFDHSVLYEVCIYDSLGERTLKVDEKDLDILIKKENWVKK